MLRRFVVILIVLSFLIPSTALAGMLSVGNSKVNFRAGPSTRNKIIYSAGQYYPVKVIGQIGGWSKTTDFEGEIGWVLTRLMSSSIKGIVVKVKKANLRSHPRNNSKIVFTAEHGAAFKYLKKSGDWILGQYADGDKGWIHKNLVWH